MKQLNVENLYFSYDDEFVFEDVSFTLPADHGCTLLVGRNGAGKSTLINVLCDLMESDGGRVERENVTIAYLPFDSPLYPHLTILENFRYFYRCFQGKDFELEEENVKYVLDALSINYIKQRFDKCSSGQQQKAGIAMMLLSGADFIIMDEPFIAIDAQSCEHLIQLIAEMKEHCAFLITTHTIDKLVEVSDHLLVLDKQHLILNTSDKQEIRQYFYEGIHHDDSL